MPDSGRSRLPCSRCRDGAQSLWPSLRSGPSVSSTAQNNGVLCPMTQVDAPFCHRRPLRMVPTDVSTTFTSILEDR
jgi:hypothetical protein